MSTGESESFAALVGIIKSEFSFLLERGFQSTIESDDSVRYDGPNDVFVRVFRDQRDRHIGFRVGLRHRPKDALTTAELARLSGQPAGGEYPQRDKDLRASVARVAGQLHAQGGRILSGDETMLDEAMQLRREYTQRFTRE